jgi:putative hemolysin
LLPKRIGLNHPEAIAKAVAYPMKMISIITAPFIWLLTISTEFLLKILMIKPSAEGKVTEEEIKAIIKEGTEGGEVQEIEQDIVERVFHIGDRKVNSLMTHRKSVVFLPLHANKTQVKEYMSRELHSVYPVYGDNYDDIVGVVNLKSIFSKIDDDQFSLETIMTDAPFIMEQTTAYKALENFKSSGIHYAFVSDEYGVFQGIITLNDILEALVGDASDFYKDDFQLVEREEGVWLVDGHYSLHDFLTYFELDELINDYEVTTVSGLIMTELSRIPKQGEKLIWQKYELEVIDMDGVKIDKVMVKAIKD